MIRVAKEAARKWSSLHDRFRYSVRTGAYPERFDSAISGSFLLIQKSPKMDAVKEIMIRENAHDYRRAEK